jgi:hypothetical protein
LFVCLFLLFFFFNRRPSCFIWFGMILGSRTRDKEKMEIYIWIYSSWSYLLALLLAG